MLRYLLLLKHWTIRVRVNSIKDSGKGMTEQVEKRIFELFYTTKEVGSGTGLGLAISHSIIESHKGL